MGKIVTLESNKGKVVDAVNRLPRRLGMENDVSMNGMLWHLHSTARLPTRRTRDRWRKSGDSDRGDTGGGSR